MKDWTLYCTPKLCGKYVSVWSEKVIKNHRNALIDKDTKRKRHKIRVFCNLYISRYINDCFN